MKIFLSTFIAIRFLLWSTVQVCSDCNMQEELTQSIEDDAWQYAKDANEFPPTPPLSSLPSFDGLRDCPILWRNKSKGDWTIRHYGEELKQVRFGSDAQVQNRLMHYVMDDLTSDRNQSPRLQAGNSLELQPVKSMDQIVAIKLYTILQEEHKNINKDTQLQLQAKIEDFACLNMQHAIQKYPLKGDATILENKRTKKKRYESALEIQVQFKNFPITIQDELIHRNPILKEILSFKIMQGTLDIQRFKSQK
jgi:hypothetical protein